MIELIILILTLSVAALIGPFAIDSMRSTCKTKCNKCWFVTNKIKVGRCCPACNNGVMLDIDED